MWVPDRYSLEARVAPVVILLLPAAITAAVALDRFDVVVPGLGGLTGPVAALSFIVTCCLVLASHIGRAGRRKQPKLFESWGGPPLRRAMRHDSDRDDTMSWDRIVAVLESRTGTPRPTPSDEVDDLAVADKVYADFENELKQATRDPKAFPQVARENRSFGFRRNLWALKPWSLAGGVVLIAAAIAAAVSGPPPDGHVFVTAAVGVAAVMLGWITVVTTTWVRDAADGYVVAIREAGLKLASLPAEQRTAS